MRFLVDECTGPAVSRWLREQGHDVLSVYDEARGASDEAMLALAVREDRVIITNDKDFGEMIFRLGKAHRGVLLLRLDDERAANKISVLARVLRHIDDIELAGQFVVATETTLRVSSGRGSR